MRPDIARVRLCVLVADGVSKLPFEALVRAVVAGGADAIQLREKNAGDDVLLEHARICRAVCDPPSGCLFIVNDRPDIAARTRADGVHVGWGDTPAPEARRIIGPDRILGISAESIYELEAAEAAGADYTGVGAVFATATKEAEVRGLELIRTAAIAATRHFLAIGGVTRDNVRDCILAGAPGVAVFSAIAAAADPQAAAKAVKDALLSALAQRDAS